MGSRSSISQTLSTTSLEIRGNNSMPLQVLNRQNMKQMSKETGFSEEYLLKLIQQAAANKQPAYINAPLPKHLR